MPLSLTEAIARVPQWVDAEDLQTAPLPGGITNQNFTVEVGGEAFVLRITGENTELLGVNRENEYAASMAAGRLGIAPEVVYFIKPESYLVTRFIEGRLLPFEEIGQAENIRQVVETIKRIHALPPVGSEFCPFQFVNKATEIVRQHNVVFPDNFEWITERMREIEAAILQHPFTPCLCHNDLLNANFLITDENYLYVLDWEYAAMGGPFFDLANFSAHHEFSDEQDRLILGTYFGEVTPSSLDRLRLMKITSDCREAMWALIQIGISQLDFDFRGYANKHFERLTQSLKDPQYEQWLVGVQLEARQARRT